MDEIRKCMMIQSCGKVDLLIRNNAQKATKHDIGFFILKLGEKLNKLKIGERFRQASHPTHTWKRENILEKKYTQKGEVQVNLCNEFLCIRSGTSKDSLGRA